MKERLFRPVAVKWGITALAAILVGIAAIPAPTPPVAHIRLVISTDVEDLLAPLIRGFNESGQKVDGKVIRVNLVVKPSGQAETDIAEGLDRASAWVPASRAWVSLLDTDSRKHWGAVVIPSLVRSPIVFSMWKGLTDCWRWPSRSFGWSDARSLTRSHKGMCGHPFQLGQTRPDTSTSGLLSTVSQFAAMAMVPPQDLTIAQIEDPRVRAGVRAIQSSVVHYCDIAKGFLPQLKKKGPAYVSAVSMQETTYIETNDSLPSNELTEVYPEEGTLFADYPFVVLRAPWVSSSQAMAARLLGQWLGHNITAGSVAASHFRLAGIVPRGASKVGETAEVHPPPGPVLARVRNAWEGLRKRANILLLVDASRHMSTQGRWLRARDFLKDFVNTLTEVDRVGLITFGDTVERRVAIEALSRNAPRLKTVLKDLLPSDTESRLFDAVHAALQEPAMRGRNAINVLLLVSPGVDEGSGHTLEQDRQELSRSHVQLIPVSYGGTGDVLRSLADSGRGQVYDGAGDPSDLSEQIASCF